MRFGVPDSKSINGEFEFEMGEGGKSHANGERGTPLILEHALHPSMPSTMRDAEVEIFCGEK